MKDRSSLGTGTHLDLSMNISDGKGLTLWTRLTLGIVQSFHISGTTRLCDFECNAYQYSELLTSPGAG